MKKQANNQSGFTLIELIVVIVILGILAATALPRFADFGKDARTASMNGVRGSLAAMSAMAHGKYLLTNTTPVAMENVSVVMDTTSGYPKASANTALAAGFTTGTDYTVDTATAGKIIISPLSAAAAATCNVTYTESVVANTPPTIVATLGGC